MPGHADTKSGDLVAETLTSKHTDGRDVDIKNLLTFDECPELIDVLVTDDNVEEVAKHLSGSAGLLGVDSTSISYWLLKCGEESSALCKPLLV